MKILIVDDELSARIMLRRVLERGPPAHITEATSAAEARSKLAEGDIDVVFIDLRLDGSSDSREGLELVRETKASSATLPIVISGSADLHEVRTAMRYGAHDYVLKEELSEELVLPILRAWESHRTLEREVVMLRARGGNDALAALIGCSTAMQQLREILQRVALSERPVLITGPTGSGKELAVRAIHSLGRHPDQALLDLNCGALPQSLIESQLFGHERGAFTGAERRHDGYFSAVGEGTLFLDEIAELPLELQAELLRVLESGTFRRVGSHQTLRFRGRVVAATHANLEERVARGLFREDLLYRLNVLEVHVPSLAERSDDIPALVAHFASQQSRKLRFSADAVDELARDNWPGNVRQLRNLIDRVAVFAPAGIVTRDVLRGLKVKPKSSTAESSLDNLVRAVLRLPEGDKLRTLESLLVDEALRLSDGNKTAAARLLGVHRKSIERRCERHEPTESADQSAPESDD